MEDFLLSVKGQIIALIRATPGIKLITNNLLRSALDGFSVLQDGNRSLSEEEKSLIYKELCNYFVADLNYENDIVELERGVMITDPDPKLHTVWEPDKTSRFYWRKQRDFLIKALTKRNGAEEASKVINSIDFETEEILKNMENPKRSKFDSRGLVLGYVQSGKTANFTALISKAADAGYRFIIVLAGIHDELRQQTQIRIDRELTGHNNLDLEGDFVEWNDYEEPKRWYNLTSAGYLDGTETGEFSGKGINRFSDIFLSRDRPALVIIKKNVKILERLLKWIDASKGSDRINTPVLIIDDEADQASIDGNANKEETDPTKTNNRIRRILDSFPRSAYVGYTATPFANVFIRHDKVNMGLGDDLYPRNFIHSLPEAKGYFGTKRIFYDDLDGYFVNKIDDPKKERLVLAEKGELTKDLVIAIYSFILGIAIRNQRDQRASPMSMMINVDHRVSKMNRIGEAIQAYIKETLPNHYDRELLAKTCDAFVEHTRLLNDKLAAGNKIPDKKEIIKEAIEIITSRAITVRVLNSSKEDKLDYAKDPSMKVIAVGGNKLSRGLTLEGLMVTFYLRESKQYDTLLQMGRWFGYRRGYEDLVRIYTSKGLWKNFKDLAIVELEFRASIREMAADNKTPKEFAVGVKQILGLLPTAKNRLGAAVLEDNYGGKQVSVTRLTLEAPEIIDENTEYTRRLVDKINKLTGFEKVDTGDHPSMLAKDILCEPLLTYIKSFNIAKDEGGDYIDFDKDDLLKFVTKGLKQGQFKRWNVALISIGRKENETIVPLPGGISLRAVNRARMKISSENGAYNIKAISDKKDRIIDLSPEAVNEYQGRINPLLLIYFVNRNSKPMQETEKPSRERLYEGISEAKYRDPVSYSIIFPGDKNAGGRFIQSIQR